MAPRELPIILGFELAICSSVGAHGFVARVVPHGWLSLETSRFAIALLGLALALLFGLEVRRRLRLLVSWEILGEGPATAGTYREAETNGERQRANEAIFRERTGWGFISVLVCVASSLVHRGPLVWSAWIVLLAAAGAMIFVRFREGAEWALLLPIFAGGAYAASGNPLVGVPQTILFVACWIIARFEMRRDPSAGWAPRS